MEFYYVPGTILGCSCHKGRQAPVPVELTILEERQETIQCMSKQEKYPTLTHAMQITKIG